MSTPFHSFHMVTLSPWPLVCALISLSLMTSFIAMFKFKLVLPAILMFSVLFVFSILWWRDVSREGAFHGDHTNKVQDGLKWGMALFIGSEALFFLAWFWAFFHHSLVPTQEIGNMWPPILLNPFNPFSVPLLNTAILLASGVFVTWAHHNMVNSLSMTIPMAYTIFLGAVFTFFQLFEYLNSLFCISDSAYGTIFFVATGFHGAHVLVGTIFLIFCLVRSVKQQMTHNHHVGLEFAIWYWHFVDVIWLFLFSFIYWWGFK